MIFTRKDKKDKVLKAYIYFHVYGKKKKLLLRLFKKLRTAVAKLEVVEDSSGGFYGLLSFAFPKHWTRFGRPQYEQHEIRPYSDSTDPSAFLHAKSAYWACFAHIHDYCDQQTRMGQRLVVKQVGLDNIFGQDDGAKTDESTNNQDLDNLVAVPDYHNLAIKITTF